MVRREREHERVWVEARACTQALRLDSRAVLEEEVDGLGVERDEPVRSRNSFGYFLGAGMTTTLPRHDALHETGDGSPTRTAQRPRGRGPQECRTQSA
jgi:hypothetical protein